MGARIIEKRNLKADRKRDARVISVVCASIVGPLLLTYLLIAADMRTDLSDLEPSQTTAEDGPALLAWKDLAVDGKRKLPRGRIRMLGYMMDWYEPVRDGTPVSRFILMPEAGQLLHPAHRIPDEMVEIQLEEDQRIPYRHRSLVWVTGALRQASGKAREGKALYAIAGAGVQPAEERDIARWFTP